METEGFNIPEVFSRFFENGDDDDDSGNEGEDDFAHAGGSSSSDTATEGSSQPRPAAGGSGGSTNRKQNPPAADGKGPELRTCRICLDTTTEAEDPELGRLFSPCKCTGTAKYVHTECLKQWRLQSANSSSYYKCPTCQFEYKMRRLKLAQIVASSAMQIGLTILIFLVTVFILGFVADPIINFYLDPYWSINPDFDTLGGFILQRNRRSNSMPIQTEKRPVGYTEHMLRGVTSLGLLGFIKALFVVPQFWIRMTLGGGGGGGGRRRDGRRGGRDRLGQLSWIIIIWGVVNFLIIAWRFVRHRTKGFLDGLADGVLDISEDPDAVKTEAKQAENNAAAADGARG